MYFFVICDLSFFNFTLYNISMDHVCYKFTNPTQPTTANWTVFATKVSMALYALALLAREDWDRLMPSE